MTEHVNAALIGCGRISKRHINWFLEKPECSISAVCDTSEEARKEAVRKITEIRPELKVASAADYQEIIENKDIQGVAILLPHSLHYSIAKQALESGKHVLVEKPMTISVEEARDLVETAQANNVLLAVAYQRSYLPEYLYVQDMIESGELGDIKFVTAHLEQTWFKGVSKMKDNPERSWKADPAKAGGGQLVDSGSHTIAAMLQVTGLTPVEVFAMIDTCGLDVDVNSSLTVRFQEGAQAAISIGGFGHSVTESLRVVGDKKSARIFFRTVAEQALEIDGEIIDAPSLVAGSTPNANFVDSILGKDSIGAGGILGLRVAQLSDGAYRSAEANKPISL